MNARQKRNRARLEQRMAVKREEAAREAAILEEQYRAEEARRQRIQAAWDARRELRRLRNSQHAQNIDRRVVMNYVIVLKNQQPVAVLQTRMPGHDRMCHRAANESAYGEPPAAPPENKPKKPLTVLSH